MRGRTCLVTGGTSGHGRAVAVGLARSGADLVLLGRDVTRCREVQREILVETGRRPDLLLCDLSSAEQVRRAAGQYLAGGRPLHVLVNNAGQVNLHRKVTVDGFEMTLAVNYLAHFQLTLLLLPRLVQAAAGRAARIVNVCSDTHRFVSLDLEDLQATRRYSVMEAYGRSKLAIAHFTFELARRLRGTNVTVNAVDPGPVESRIGMNHEGIAPKALALVMKLFFPSPARAARAALRLCTSAEMERVTGGYYKFGRRRWTRATGDRATAARLWEISARLTGVDLPSGG